MDITSLTVVLSVIVVVAASVLIVSNEPPLWVCLLSAAGSLPLSSALLDGPDFTSPIDNGSLAAWALRIAVSSTITAVFSFFVGGHSRASADDDVPDEDEPATPVWSSAVRPGHGQEWSG
jgi:hypothetical protein